MDLFDQGKFSLLVQGKAPTPRITILLCSQFTYGCPWKRYTQLEAQFNYTLFNYTLFEYNRVESEFAPQVLRDQRKLNKWTLFTLFLMYT